MHSKDGKAPIVIELKPGVRFRSGRNARLQEALFDDRVLLVLEVIDEGGQVHVAVEDPTMGQIRRAWFDPATLLDGARPMQSGDVLTWGARAA